MASHQTVEIDTALNTDDIRAQLTALAETFERMAAEARTGLMALNDATKRDRAGS